jgi:hypothetical protein
VLLSLSLSHIISLSLLNDKKKEEEMGEVVGKKEEMGEVVGKKEEMEGRRRNKEKSSVLGCRIVLCILLIWQLVIGGCKSWVLQLIRIKVKSEK